MAEMLKTRLDRHFVACSAVAAAAAVTGTTQNAEAAIVYSGVVNTPIPNTFAGIYVDVGAGVSAGAPFTGWDLNPYYSSNLLRFYVNGNGTNPDNAMVGTGGNADNLVPGTLISGGSTFGALTNGTTIAGGTTGLFGFQFFLESDSSIHYGWAHVSTTTAGGGTLVDFAWENSVGAGIQAGAVPAPASLALLALGGAGLMARRRK